jgi:hypothetical protein
MTGDQPIFPISDFTIPLQGAASGHDTYQPENRGSTPSADPFSGIIHPAPVQPRIALPDTSVPELHAKNRELCTRVSGKQPSRRIYANQGVFHGAVKPI